MENEKKFEEILDEYNYTTRVENSLKNYTNWLLGISIGLAAALISIPKDCEVLPYFIIILILIFLGILINGVIKYLLFLREIRINTIFGELKKIKISREAKMQFGSKPNDKIDFEKWNEKFQEHTTETNKIVKIAKFINYSTYFTLLNVILTGIIIVIALI